MIQWLKILIFRQIVVAVSQVEIQEGEREGEEESLILKGLLIWPRTDKRTDRNST
jgi:hypothetical protein